MRYQQAQTRENADLIVSPSSFVGPPQPDQVAPVVAASNKKADAKEHRKYSTTSTYFATSLPARPGCHHVRRGTNAVLFSSDKRENDWTLVKSFEYPQGWELSSEIRSTCWLIILIKPQPMGNWSRSFS
jgi:hypothetical protein